MNGNAEEPKKPIVLVQHYQQDGEKWHRKYVRYFRPNGSVRDFLIHKSQKKCDCDGGG